MKFETSKKQTAFRVALVAPIGAFLVACGGGNSGPGVTTTPTPAAMMSPSELSKLCAFSDDD